MGYTFNGTIRRVTLDPGTIQLDLVDLYSRWLDWARLNPQYLQAFRVSGGEPDGTGGFTGRYIFIMNGWSIVPQSANHTLNVIGNIYRDPDDLSGVPIVSPVAGFTVNAIFNRSAQAQGISVSGSTLTPGDIWQYSDRRLTPTGINDIWNNAINTSTGAGRVLWRIAKLMGLTSESVTAKDDAFVRVGNGSDIDQSITVNPDGSRTLGGSP